MAIRGGSGGGDGERAGGGMYLHSAAQGGLKEMDVPVLGAPSAAAMRATASICALDMDTARSCTGAAGSGLAAGIWQCGGRRKQGREGAASRAYSRSWPSPSPIGTAAAVARAVFFLLTLISIYFLISCSAEKTRPAPSREGPALPAQLGAHLHSRHGHVRRMGVSRYAGDAASKSLGLPLQVRAVAESLILLRWALTR